MCSVSKNQETFRFLLNHFGLSCSGLLRTTQFPTLFYNFCYLFWPQSMVIFGRKRWNDLGFFFLPDKSNHFAHFWGVKDFPFLLGITTRLMSNMMAKHSSQFSNASCTSWYKPFCCTFLPPHRDSHESFLLLGCIFLKPGFLCSQTIKSFYQFWPFPVLRKPYPYNQR